MLRRRALGGSRFYAVVLAQFKGAFFPFYKNQSLRKTLTLEWVFRVGHLNDHGGRSAHSKHHRRYILPRNPGVNLLRIAIETIGFAKQEPRNIQNVAAQVHQDEFFKIAQKWLIAKDWEAGDHVEPGAKRGANFSALKNLLERAQRSLPPPVFVHQETNAGVPAGFYHLFGNCQGRRHRLLANHRQPVGSCHVHKDLVMIHVSGNVDEVQDFFPQQFLRIVVRRRNPKLGG